MKKIAVISLVLVVTACGGRYVGWEAVRIEQAKPSDACQYKAQESCSKPGADCYEYYKKRATTFGANTVVITSEKSGHKAGWNFTNGAPYSVDAITALADYYQCPAQ